jgi:hypothetical protein
MDIADNLKNHVAKYEHSTLLGVPIENIQFRNPVSSNYYMSFIAIRGNLIVTGDAYDAIYEVSNHQTMKWWSQCDACYLASKLRGLDGHSDEHRKWDYKEAEKEISKLKDELRKEVLEEYRSEFEAADGEQLEESFEDFCNKRDKVLEQAGNEENYDGAIARWINWLDDDPIHYSGSDQEWGIFLNDRGSDYFGNCDLPYDVGFIRNPQIDFHLEGLKTAVKQLEAQGIKLL